MSTQTWNKRTLVSQQKQHLFETLSDLLSLSAALSSMTGGRIEELRIYEQGRRPERKGKEGVCPFVAGKKEPRELKQANSAGENDGYVSKLAQLRADRASG